MYLRRLYIENSGPLGQLHLELPFTVEGLPQPIVLVGENGSGKTNLLSVLADALFEAAAAHYTDVIPGASVNGRPWFRINGGPTLRLGTRGGCTLLQFESGTFIHVYKDKTGTLNPTEIQPKVPELLRPYVNWPTEGSVKEFSISDEQSKKVFEEGIYIYLPSSRAEIPHWLNRSSLPTDDFDLTPRISKQLRKPIYVERGIEQLKQWMLSLLIDTRMDVLPIPQGTGFQMVATGSAQDLVNHKVAWEAMNEILRHVLNDASARFVWLGRMASSRVGIFRNSLGGAIPLESLSAGQATLLNIFGTMLRYGDGTTGAVLRPGDLVGICAIDEIDAHMHIDLQHRALPQLMRMFPRIQFIVSSHSPLFVLGMEQVFGGGALAIIDMPSGTPIKAEAYAEFGRALAALRETQAFDRAILEVAGQPGKLLVLLEGETDPIYLRTAAQLLGKGGIEDLAEFEWVGAKDPKSGQGFHTGKDSLNSTASLLRAKPELAKRPVVLIYDNDVNKLDADFPNLYVRSMQTNDDNTQVESGIENILPSASITQDMFDEKTTKRKQGGSVTNRTLNKMKLCKYLCEVKRDPADFAGFSSLLDMVSAIATSAHIGKLVPPLETGPQH